MKVQELLEKVSEQGVGLYELKGYSLVVRDTDGDEKTIEKLTVDEEKKQIRIKLK